MNPQLTGKFDVNWDNCLHSLINDEFTIQEEESRCSECSCKLTRYNAQIIYVKDKKKRVCAQCLPKIWERS